MSEWHRRTGQERAVLHGLVRFQFISGSSSGELNGKENSVLIVGLRDRH